MKPSGNTKEIETSVLNAGYTMGFNFLPHVPKSSLKNLCKNSYLHKSNIDFICLKFH